MAFMEKVQIVIENIVKNSKSIESAQKRTERLANANRRLNKAITPMNAKLSAQNAKIRHLSKSFDSFGGVMGLSLPQFQAFSAAGAQMNTRMGRLGMTVRNATHGLKGFRMELLGVMFFGMMVMNFFKGLLRPAMDAFGVFELWSDMLTIVFLPIMQEIFPYMLDFMTWMMDLPGPVKKALGVVALLGLAVGFTAFLLGSLGLGIGSVIMVLSGMSFGASILAMRTFAINASKLAIKLLAISGKAIMSGLGKLGTAINGLGSTALGSSLIIAAAFLAAFAISSKGLKNQGKEYTSVWAGIAGTVVDAVVGIGVLLLGLGGIVKTILEIVWKSFKNVFTSLGKAIWVWFSGGDFKETFMSTMKSIDMADILQKNLLPAGQVAMSANIIKEKMGLTQDIAGSDVAIAPSSSLGGSEFISGLAPTNQSSVPTSNVVNVTNNINVSDKVEMEKAMDENQRKMMDELRRMSTLS